jgi:hypothetical protein
MEIINLKALSFRSNQTVLLRKGFNASVGKIKPRSARFAYPLASLNRFAAVRDRRQ